MPSQEQLHQAQRDEQPPKFLRHLIELRKRLLRCLIILTLVFIALFSFANDFYELLAIPMMQALAQDSTMIATSIAAPFITPFKLTFIVAIFISMPFLLYQAWAFIAPGLYQTEKRIALPLFVSSVLLFYLGILFAYFIVFPLLFDFFYTVAPNNVQVMPDIGQYLDFTLKLFFAFGVAFEVPVATILLIISGVVSLEKLISLRPYIIVAAFIVGMLLTPPDVISQVLLAVPIWLLFEVGIVCARFLRQP